jgi:hypothetical protein
VTRGARACGDGSISAGEFVSASGAWVNNGGAAAPVAAAAQELPKRG